MMTLHETILSVIRKNGESMKPRDIAVEINKFSLYKSKTGNPIGANQVWARANKFSNIFEITSDKKIGELFNEIAAQKEFIKWVRNYSAHNFGYEFEILIPFLVFLFYKDPTTNQTVLIEADFDSIFFDDDKQTHLLQACNKLEHFFPSDISLYSVKEILGRTNNSILFELVNQFRNFYDLLLNCSKVNLRKLYQEVIIQLSSMKSKNSEFATPESLVKFIANIVSIKPNQTIYDPFAGLCVLLSEVCRKASNESRVIANDINEKVGILGLMNLLISDVIHVHYTIKNSFAFNNLKIKDWIITNPPFGKYTLNKSHDHSFDNPVSLVYSRLEKKGKAVIIVQDSFLHSEEKGSKFLRRQLLEEKAIAAIISLPKSIFLPFAGVDTSIIILEKGVEHNEIYFAELGNISKEEFEYKVEEYASWYKKRTIINGHSSLLNIQIIKKDPFYNLLPRKHIFKYSLKIKDSIPVIALKDLIKRKFIGKSVVSSNMNEDKDGIPYLRISDLPDNETIAVLLEAPKKYISDIELVQPIRYLVEPGTIILARIGNKLKPTLYSYSEPAVPSNHLLCFTVDEEKVYPSYLINELKGDYVKQQLDAIQIRGAGPSYYKEKDLLDIKIKLPLKENQITSTLETLSLYDFEHIEPIQSFSRIARISNSFRNLNFEGNKDLKIIREKEIISSIKHRVSQYISPINNDLRNLRYFIKNKSKKNDSVSFNDKINDLPDASLLSEVFLRMESNLKGISKTFRVINDILYFEKNDSHFAKVNIKEIIESAKKSIEKGLQDVEFVFATDEGVIENDLIISIDSDQIEELVRNFIFNSIKHGFDASVSKKIIYVLITKDRENNNLEINLINNGNPFPDNYTKEDFISFGRKGTESDGSGIGGYLINKIIENHEGAFHWLCNQNFRFKIDTIQEKELQIIANVYFKISLPYITD